MTKHVGRNNQSPNRRSRVGQSFGGVQSPAAYRSEPLRHEAERVWDESDRSTATGLERRNKRSQAQKLRRQSSREKDDLIARLSEKVARLEGELARYLQRHKAE